MPSLKEVRNKIVSTRNMQKITKAMKVVSAAKLRKAQQRIVQMRPYAHKLQEMLSHLSGSSEGSDAAKFFDNRPVNRVLVVAITSDSGLAGSFNGSILKDSVLLIKKTYADQYNAKNVDVLAVGKKSAAFFKKNNYKVIQEHTTLFKNLNYDAASEIASFMVDQFLTKNYDAVDIIYNRFKNAAVYIPTTERFLPVPVIVEDHNTTATSQGSNQKHYSPDYIFEPSQEEILSRLIVQSLKTSFFRALLESNTAEHGARMTAMDKASENAEELLNKYKLAYNKARQATITKEILEIVGGAAALAG
jgi:F-type H+-transporting ATPase subunit gamma